MVRRASLTLLLCGLPLVAAAEVEVVSNAPDSVSVTIYRDLFALITETRTVELPAEAHTLAFDNVVESLIPASAVVGELDRDLLERNYDYESLAPANLLRRSIGREVTLTRVLPGSGKVVQTPAVVAAANDGGVVLRSPDGHEALNCSGLPERLTFTEIPGDLHPTPRLAVRLAAGQPGRRTLRLSYLAQGFAWRADYVAHLDPGGRRLDLTGWVTLRNLTRSTLRQANVQVVAGRLNLLYDGDGGTSTIGATEDFADENELQEARNHRLEEILDEQDWTSDLTLLRGCFPAGQPRTISSDALHRRYRQFGQTMLGSDEMMEVVVTGARQSLAPPEALADYHLYRVPWPTDLNARQTKQAVFLQKPRVKAERFYSLRVDAEDRSLDLEDEVGPLPLRPAVKLALRNERASGLGEPLPAGILRVFERGPAGMIFAGETPFGDKPVGVPIELTFAEALDLAVQVRVDDDPADFDDDYAEATDFTFQVSNAKSRAVPLEIRLALPEEAGKARIVRPSQRPTRKHGDFAWRLNVAPNGGSRLTYRLVTQDYDEDE